MERPPKRRRLDAREAIFRVASALRECHAERVAPVATEDAYFETSHRAILIDHAATRQCQSWYFDFDLHAAIRTACATRKVAETLNALANCEGYVPEEAPQFWREEIPKLSDIGYSIHSHVTPEQLHVITHETLANYRLYCGFEKPNADGERLASVLAAAISSFPDAEARSIRQRAIAQFGAFLAYRHAPQEVSIELCTSIPTKSVSVSWSLVRSTMFHLSRRWTTALKTPPAPQRSHTIKLIADTGSRHAIDDTGLRDLAEIAAMDCVSITELDCKIDVANDSTIAAFRRLMRALARVGTLRAMTLRFRFYDDRYVAAVCSALPKMRSLRFCCLRIQAFRSLAVASLASVTDPGSYYSWLYYAMTAARCRLLTLEIDATKEAGAKILQARQAVHVLGPSLAFKRQDKFALQSNGTTAKLAAGALLSTAASTEASSDGDTSLLVEPDSELHDWVEVVALFQAKVVVVVPGIGLMWVDAASLSEWRTIPAGMNSTPRVTIERLALQARHESHAIDVVELVGEDLTSLCMRQCSIDASKLLLRIPRVCPRLEKLGFIGTHVDNFNPLLEAYRSERGCNIKTIFYHHTSDTAQNSQLFQTFHFGLQELSISASLKRHCQIELKTSLEAYSTLRYLRCGTLEGRTHWFGGDIVGPLRDKPLRRSECSRTTAYAFLWAARCHQELMSLPLPCVRIVVEFAATLTLRHISWHDG